ncbi:MAG: helix-turn-helix domain-containing protein [Steroidobacteraceae bacterium]
MRLEAATVLLQGPVTAAEVAQSVGYDYTQTFYAAFERRYGCTPGVFRRRCERAASNPRGAHDERVSPH